MAVSARDISNQYSEIDPEATLPYEHSESRMQVGEYVCTLDEKSIKKAKKELNEDPKERAGAVKALRDWVNQQQWLRFPTDDTVLLAILRVRKFSQLRAREMVESILTTKAKCSEWYIGNDPTDPKAQKIWKEGVYVPLPRDKDGQRALLMRIGKMDPSGKSYTADEFIKANAMVFDYLLMDENTQVNGLIFIIDLTGMDIKHTTFFGLARNKKTTEALQKSVTARMKGIHYYNTGPIFESVFEVVKVFMSDKLRSRIHFHGQSLVSLYEKVDMSILPDEYLPDDYKGPSAGSVQDLITNYVEELNKPHIQQWVKRMHSPEWGIDLSKKPNDEPQASFRKLNVS
ncbi:hypothetical protein ScPMuIL_001595 [Solemya velum]